MSRGTTMKALAHGVPVLSVPLGRDQADNAVRVVEVGSGLRRCRRRRIREVETLAARSSPPRIARPRHRAQLAPS